MLYIFLTKNMTGWSYFLFGPDGWIQLANVFDQPDNQSDNAYETQEEDRRGTERCPKQPPYERVDEKPYERNHFQNHGLILLSMIAFGLGILKLKKDLVDSVLHGVCPSGEFFKTWVEVCRHSHHFHDVLLRLLRNLTQLLFPLKTFFDEVFVLLPFFGCEIFDVILKLWHLPYLPSSGVLFA